MVNCKRRCVIVGAGGHASMVIEALEAMGNVDVVAVLDRNPELCGHQILGCPVSGGDELLPQLRREGANCFVVGLGGIGDNSPRIALYQLACSYDLQPLTVIHPSATVSGRATIGAGSVVLNGALVNGGARIGMNAIINTGAIVEHDCQIADHVHVATGAVLCGGVVVGDSAHIGAGAVVRQYLAIGSHALVAAGSVVVRNVENHTLVKGVPAK